MPSESIRSFVSSVDEVTPTNIYAHQSEHPESIRSFVSSVDEVHPTNIYAHQSEHPESIRSFVSSVDEVTPTNIYAHQSEHPVYHVEDPDPRYDHALRFGTASHPRLPLSRDDPYRLASLDSVDEAARARRFAPPPTIRSRVRDLWRKAKGKLQAGSRYVTRKLKQLGKRDHVEEFEMGVPHRSCPAPANN